jgi:hypothetical protein
VGESMSPLERKPDAGDSHVRFDERGVETECRAGYSGTGNRKGRPPLRPSLNITAPLLDSTNSKLSSERFCGERLVSNSLTRVRE